MKVKKVYAVMLAAAVALGTVGCGNKAETEKVSQSSSISSEKEDNKAENQGGQTDGQGGSQSETETDDKPEGQTQDGQDQDVKEETMGGENEVIEVPEWDAVEIPDNEALEFVKDMQLGWNLGNTFDASNCGASDELEYESAWVGIKTTKEMIHTIADAGFKTIRIPVSWHNHVDAEYRISEAWMDRVQEVVDWALEEELYVILNIHHDNEEGFMYPSYEHLEQSKKYVQAVWEQIAERFAEYDEKLILRR